MAEKKSKPKEKKNVLCEEDKKLLEKYSPHIMMAYKSDSVGRTVPAIPVDDAKRLMTIYKEKINKDFTISVFCSHCKIMALKGLYKLIQ